MHNTSLSIFILPVLIIGLSVFTTFVEESPSFRTLFQISQVANPSVNEDGQDLIDMVQNESVEEISEESVVVPNRENSETNMIETDRPKEERNEKAIQENNEKEQQLAPSSNQTPTTLEDSNEKDSSDESPLETTLKTEIEESEILAQKIAQFEVARSNISYKFKINLSKLEDARDNLAKKITLMEQEGKDTTQAKDALMNLDESIKKSRSYIKDSKVPDSVPGIQRLLAEYVKNARDSIQEGYNALFNAAKQAQ